MSLSLAASDVAEASKQTKLRALVAFFARFHGILLFDMVCAEAIDDGAQGARDQITKLIRGNTACLHSLQLDSTTKVTDEASSWAPTKTIVSIHVAVKMPTVTASSLLFCPVW